MDELWVNTELERSIIASVLLYGTKAYVSLSMINASDFSQSSNIMLWQIFDELTSKGMEIDLQVVAEDVRTATKRRGVAIACDLEDMRSYATDSIEAAVAQARKLVQLAQARRLEHVFIQANSKAKNQRVGPEEYALFVQEEYGKAMAHKSEVSITMSADMAHRAWARYERAHQTQGADLIRPGLAELDARIPGWKPGQLIVLAARPGMGKSALGLLFAMSASAQERFTLLCSLEMPEAEVTDRLVAGFSGISAIELAKRGFGDQQEQITQALEQVHNLRLSVFDQRRTTISDIRARALQLKLTRPIGLLIVDYLQRVTPLRRLDSREREVSEITVGLRNLAQELECPVIALAQLNREIESRSDKRPQLSDLRESGAIEQEADLVLGLYRDAYYNKESAVPHEAEVIILKHRGGPTGTAMVGFDRELTRFYDLDMNYPSRSGKR